MPPIFNPDTNNTLLDAVRLILMIAIPLAFLASIGTISMYRRAILRGMRSRSDSGKPEPSPNQSATRSHKPAHTPLQTHVLDSASGPRDRSPSAELYPALRHGPRRAAMVYTVAGLCYALVTTTIFLRATKSDFQLLNFLIVFWYYAWPVAVTLSLLVETSWVSRLKVFAIYFLIPVLILISLALGFLPATGDSLWKALQIFPLWLTTNFPAALLLLAFLNRKVRAVGPLVLTFITLASTGLVLLPTFVINIGEIWDPLMSLRERFGLNIGGIFNLVFLVGVLGFGLLGWLAVNMIGNWYSRKQISEQSITMDAIWLLFGIFQAVGLIFEGDHWFTVSLMAFAVYKVVAWTSFWLANRYAPLSQIHPSLLVLRVFAPGKRSEELFEALSKHWRLVGSIQLIAGPDLAATTIEPHEFLDFLSGKLARRFIDGEQTLDLRISQMDLLPDHDGQFRVNDFFCYEDTWRMVLSRLARASDAVMMDLRGFSSQNAGVIYEIGELIDLVPLEQVVFIVDDTTDEPFLRQVMQEAWDQKKPDSPNRAENSGLPNIFRLKRLGARELQGLLQAISEAVHPAAGIQTMTGPSVSSIINP